VFNKLTNLLTYFTYLNNDHNVEENIKYESANGPQLCYRYGPRILKYYQVPGLQQLITAVNIRI